MPTELDDDIRAALLARAGTVTPERLRHLESPRPPTPSRQHRRWALTGPVLAAACVAALAVAITLVSSDSRGGNAPASGGASELTRLIGTAWSLTAVRHDGSDTVAIPQRLSAGVAFELGGVLSAQDGVNGYQAHYRLTGASEVTITAGYGTLVGYAGHDPHLLAAINGIAAILYRAHRRASPNPVTVNLGPNQLTLAANGYTLTLGDEVPVATSAASRPSTSPFVAPSNAHPKGAAS